MGAFYIHREHSYMITREKADRKNQCGSPAYSFKESCLPLMRSVSLKKQFKKSIGIMVDYTTTVKLINFTATSQIVIY